MPSTCRSCLPAWSCSQPPGSRSRRASGGSKIGSCPGPRTRGTMARKLQISHLGKTFGELQALQDINLAVERGEFIAVVGPSGCGKTTFLRIVAGLEPASSGEVALDGRAVRGPGGDRGFVFQRDNLARALAIDPQILLMDEPFSSLDAQTREIMQTELMRIWEDGRKTVLFVTHQIDEAVFSADRVLVFARRPGRLRESVAIALARPRALAIKRTAEFVRYVDHIWRLIEDDVRASVIEEKV